MRCQILFVIAILQLLEKSDAKEWETTVNITSGLISGTRSGTTNVFLGVPFAAPPVGPLRWKAPRPVTPWNGTRPAVENSKICMQILSEMTRISFTLPVNVSMSEDCLYLNVFAPAQSEGSLPVMFWIHGGGLESGGNAEYRYRGEMMSSMGNVVLVVINYRLGSLGFLAHPLFAMDDGSFPSSGNYGVLDQRMALMWVRDNIAKFGGDPSKVTIFGESAGGASVCFHMVMKKSWGLFSKAIMQSAACFIEVKNQSEASAIAIDVEQKLNCTRNDVRQTLDCLRSADPLSVLRLIPSGTTAATVENYELMKHPFKAIQNKEDVAQVPLISGNTLDEGIVFANAVFDFLPANHPRTLNEEEYTLGLSLTFGKATPLVQKYYPCAMFDPKNCLVALSNAIGDSGLVCPSKLFADALSASGQNVYSYVFTRAPFFALPYLPVSFHTAELPFVFSTLNIYPGTPAGEITLASAMTRYWTAFGTSGDPNSGTPIPGAAPLPTWPKYSGPKFERMMFDLNLTLSQKYKSDRCRLWEGLYSVFFNF